MEGVFYIKQIVFDYLVLIFHFFVEENVSVCEFCRESVVKCSKVSKMAPKSISPTNKMFTLFHMLCLGCKRAENHDSFMRAILANFDLETLCDGILLTTHDKCQDLRNLIIE